MTIEECIAGGLSVENLCSAIVTLQTQMLAIQAQLAQCCGGDGGGGAASTACAIQVTRDGNNITVSNVCVDAKNKCKIVIKCGTNQIYAFDLNCGSVAVKALTSKCVVGNALLVTANGVPVYMSVV